MTMNSNYRIAAPELAVSTWFNTPAPFSLERLRGRVVFLHAFQMLCPACVSHGLPQTQRVQTVFRETDLQVIGLHSVFEHHAVMTPDALKAFIHEYRLTFPIAVDQPSDDGPIPKTMERYGMRGTPTAIIIGRDGHVEHHRFGIEDDMVIGARLATLLAAPIPNFAAAGPETLGCTSDGCSVPDTHDGRR
ncbi:redoxin domain-containing protein [Ensifer sp. ENS12]|nr:redoxin domain-containing protein [Ensifer sp. ENS12]MBV7522270.1 redoxin domain-containing protein [Ensifer sp. ENS12]